MDVFKLNEHKYAQCRMFREYRLIHGELTPLTGDEFRGNSR